MVAAGGAGTQKSVGTGGGGAAEGRRTQGGEEPRGPRRFRTGKLVLPKSRHPSVRTPLRPRASEPGGLPEDPTKWTRAGRESPETGTPEPERAGRAELCGDSLPRTKGSWPADPERRRCGARSAGARQRRRAGALPAAARSGRGRPEAAGGGVRATAQALYKGASPARRRRRRRADATKVCSLCGAEGSLPRSAPHPGPPKPHLGSRGARRPSAVAGARDVSCVGQRSLRSAGAAAPPRQRGC